MPINIVDYSDVKTGERGKLIDHFCSDKWEMPIQLDGLEKWLKDNGNNISPGNYVADLGFSPREGAAGGGGVLSNEAMKVMVEIGMELHLSEYPSFDNEKIK